MSWFKKEPTLAETLGGLALVYGTVSCAVTIGYWVGCRVGDLFDAGGSAAAKAVTEANAQRKMASADKALTVEAQQALIAEHGEESLKGMDEAALAALVEATKAAISAAGMEQKVGKA